jgi:Spy/CpxP family protein refolding chaperone
MKESLKNDVGFNDQQMAEYEDRVNLHRRQMRPLFEDISRTKEAFYQMLTKPGTQDSLLNSAAKEIGEKQKLIDLKIFMHFQNIRQLCTPAQQPMFDSLILRVVHRMVFPMRKGGEKKDSATLKK